MQEHESVVWSDTAGIWSALVKDAGVCFEAVLFCAGTLVRSTSFYFLEDAIAFLVMELEQSGADGLVVLDSCGCVSVN